MPCRDGRDDEYRSYENTEKIDRLTRILCYVMSNLAPEGILILIGSHAPEARELREWWEKHQLDDKIRRENEARAKKIHELRISGLAKLTPEEKNALNL